jgi:hypothetical protein
MHLGKFKIFDAYHGRTLRTVSYQPSLLDDEKDPSLSY